MNLKRNCHLSLNHSFFLFGPRGTGKSTLLSDTFQNQQTLMITLLNTEILSLLEQEPHRLVGMVEAAADISWVIIDEVQYIPDLLNEVHYLIEKYPHLKFALTGSSARKLKRGQANLLAGRAFSFYLFPFTHLELGSLFDLQQTLEYGSLPKIFSLENALSKQRFLKAYTQTYLKEEVQAEGAVRNLKGFKRFLEIAAHENGNCLNFSNIAQDVGIDSKTVKSYFEILEDTLLGFILPAFHKSIRKRQKTHPKFYFFDVGVTRTLTGKIGDSLPPGSEDYGRAFEHFIILELLRLNQYYEKDYKFSYLASPSMEIDLVIERPGKPTLLLEIKSRNSIQEKHIHALKNVVSEIQNAKGICICQEPLKRLSTEILICPWQEVFTEVFS